MIDNEFCTLEQSLALKELGFNEPCFGYFYDGKLTLAILFHNNIGDGDNVVRAPLRQQAFRWFREKNMFFNIQDYYSKESSKTYGRGFQIFINGIQLGYSSSSHSSVELYFNYDDAELACINKLIDLIKK